VRRRRLIVANERLADLARNLTPLLINFGPTGASAASVRSQCTYWVYSTRYTSGFRARFGLIRARAKVVAAVSTCITLKVAALRIWVWRRCVRGRRPGCRLDRCIAGHRRAGRKWFGGVQGKAEIRQCLGCGSFRTAFRAGCCVRASILRRNIRQG